MDRNKVITLRQIGYKIRQSCGICTHGTFREGFWGTCETHKYSHEKHTGEDRQLSIHRSGICEGFKPDAEISHDMRHYAEFLDKDLK